MLDLVLTKFAGLVATVADGSVRALERRDPQRRSPILLMVLARSATDERQLSRKLDSETTDVHRWRDAVCGGVFAGVEWRRLRGAAGVHVAGMTPATEATPSAAPLSCSHRS
ncbi:hypothetical protein ACQP2U_07770 [Nocardia sp. CA-084685]|uniref:hypothetical protein n=1 Tax=Nocardia sp. CA-084685 TaxID=3239970 RepID=UPI003D987707